MCYDQVKLATKVDVRKQLKPSEYVSFDGLEKDGLRVMFVGNSITLHGVNEGIGWFHKWGMAASAAEKDYVHLCSAHIRKQFPDAVFCICQVGEWERKWRDGNAVLPLFQEAQDFEADVILIKLGGNCPGDHFDKKLFKDNFSSLVDYLTKNKKANIVIASEFYRHPCEAVLAEYAQESGALFVSLSDLGERPEMKALGLFEHDGVANHPGDLGMQTIAERFCKQFDSIGLADQKSK